jgi:hypothetical protein
MVKGTIIFFLAGRNSSSFLWEFNTIFNKFYIASGNLALSPFSTISLLSNNAGPTSKGLFCLFVLQSRMGELNEGVNAEL